MCTIISFGASGDTCLSGPLTSEAPFTRAVWPWAHPLPSCSSAFPPSEEDHRGTYWVLVGKIPANREGQRA